MVDISVYPGCSQITTPAHCHWFYNKFEDEHWISFRVLTEERAYLLEGMSNVNKLGCEFISLIEEVAIETLTN